MSEPPSAAEAVRELAGALAVADGVPRVAMPVGEGVGHDPAKAVTAVVDADLRLVSLSVISGWRQRVDPDGLTVALMAAIREAGRAVMPPDLAESVSDQSASDLRDDRDDARRRLLEDAKARAHAAPQELPNNVDPAYEEQAAAQVAEFRAAFAGIQVPEYAEVAAQTAPILDLLNEATTALTDLATGAGHGPSPARISSPNLRVQFHYCGGMPAHIDIDRNWLANQSGTALTETFSSIIERHRAGRVAPPVDDRLEAAVRQTFLGQSPEMMALLGFGASGTDGTDEERR